jgi:hypothetical protein
MFLLQCIMYTSNGRYTYLLECRTISDLPVFHLCIKRNVQSKRSCVHLKFLVSVRLDLTKIYVIYIVFVYILFFYIAFIYRLIGGEFTLGFNVRHV